MGLKDSLKVNTANTGHPTLLPSSSAQRVNREEIGKMRNHLAKISKTEMYKLTLRPIINFPLLGTLVIFQANPRR